MNLGLFSGGSITHQVRLWVGIHSMRSQTLEATSLAWPSVNGLWGDKWSPMPFAPDSISRGSGRECEATQHKSLKSLQFTPHVYTVGVRPHAMDRPMVCLRYRRFLQAKVQLQVSARHTMIVHPIHMRCILGAHPCAEHVRPSKPLLTATLM